MLFGAPPARLAPGQGLWHCTCTKHGAMGTRSLGDLGGLVAIPSGFWSCCRSSQQAGPKAEGGRKADTADNSARPTGCCSKARHEHVLSLEVSFKNQLVVQDIQLGPRSLLFLEPTRAVCRAEVLSLFPYSAFFPQKSLEGSGHPQRIPGAHDPLPASTELQRRNSRSCPPATALYSPSARAFEAKIAVLFSWECKG